MARARATNWSTISSEAPCSATSARNAKISSTTIGASPSEASSTRISRGLLDVGAGHGDHLLLAAGRACRHVGRAARRGPGTRRWPVRCASASCPGAACSHQVLAHGERAEDATSLGDVAQAVADPLGRRESLVTSSPSTATCPAVGSDQARDRLRAACVLPAPLGPSRAATAPVGDEIDVAQHVGLAVAGGDAA